MLEVFLLCLKVFACRILDVSLGTVRTIFTVRQRKLIASLIGFVEVLIWFLIVREALNSDVNSIWVALSYAGGYATGTYVGGAVAKLLIRGKVTVQILTTHKNQDMINALKDKGFAMTITDAHGAVDAEEKYLIMMQIEEKHMKDIKGIINHFDEDAYVNVTDVKEVYNGYFKK